MPKKVTKRRIPPGKPHRRRIKKHLTMTLITAVMAFVLVAYQVVVQHVPIEAMVSFLKKPAGQSLTTLTVQQRKNLDRELSGIVAHKNPRAALNRLSSLMKSNQLVLKSCHGFTHTIGHASQDKYRDLQKSLSYQDDLCGSGYIHGVIEEYFANSKDVVAALANACAQYQSGKCYHGVGHGLMYYTANNVPKAERYCDTIANHTFRARCGEGIFMENFATMISNPIHRTKFRDPKSPLYPCASQPGTYQNACYYYAPLYYLTLHSEDYSGALKVCAKAYGYANTCTQGVGSRIMKEHINDPGYSEKQCRTGADWQLLPCVYGMATYHLVDDGSRVSADKMCASLSPKLRQFCWSAVAAQGNLYF